MIITVNRFKSDADTTIGALSINGVFECFTLEDEPRAFKVSGETRIPAGTYKLGLRTVGGFHGRYGSKFPSFHKGMLEVKDVRGFEYILIHIGNYDSDTAGCLLVGAGCQTTDGDMSIQSSRIAYERLYKKIIANALTDNLEIEYIDNDNYIKGEFQ